MMLQKWLEQLAELIAQKVADKLTALISAQFVAAEQNILANIQTQETKIAQIPQQIIAGVLQGIPSILNPFKGGR